MSTKAKTLNRLELTERLMRKNTPCKTQTYDKCPECGHMSLIHEGGCMHCMNCGYDACGVH